MVVRLNDLQATVVLGEKLFNVLGGLIVHDVQLWFEPFLF